MIKKTICLLLFAVVLLAACSGCERSGEEHSKPSSGTPPFSSYRDIPGVTDEEIAKIEALREQFDSFVFGMMPSTETFIDKNGELKGFITFLCEQLTELFGIPFTPAHYTWGDLLEGLKSGDIAFTAALAPTEHRRKIYHMTGAIAQREVKYIRLAGSEPLSKIRQARLPVYAMLSGAASAGRALSNINEEFELVLIPDYIDAYELMKSGKIDALVAEGTAEAVFDIYGDVVVEVFFPLAYAPIATTTQTPELKPIIDVLQKALENGAYPYLKSMYNQSYQEYTIHKLFMKLSEQEFAYIDANPVIPILGEYDNYPISFYNTRENAWQGIAFDVLREITSLTGLEFKVINDKNT